MSGEEAIFGLDAQVRIAGMDYALFAGLGILAAGIARVVVGCRDPNPLVDGRGVARSPRHALLDVVDHELRRGLLLQRLHDALEAMAHDDPHDPHPLVPRVPPGFTPGASNRSWKLFSRCG